MTAAYRAILLLLWSVVLFAWSGCDESSQVRVYESDRPASYHWPPASSREQSYAQMVQTHQGPKEQKWVWDVPPGWVDAPERSSFHIADYRFPGSRQTLPGRLTISVSPGDGGGLEHNIERWRGQLFLKPPPGPAPTDSIHSGIQLPIGAATIVEFAGQYQGEHVPTHMLGVIVQAPAQGGGVFQTWFFKMLGDRQTVANHRLALFRLLLSLRLEGTPAPKLPADLFERGILDAGRLTPPSQNDTGPTPDKDASAAPASTP